MIRLTANQSGTAFYVDASRIAYVDAVRAGNSYENPLVTALAIDGYASILRVRETPAQVAQLKTAWGERYEGLDASPDGIVYAVFINADGVIDVEYLPGYEGEKA